MSIFATNATIDGLVLVDSRNREWPSVGDARTLASPYTADDPWSSVIDTLLQWHDHPEQIADADLPVITLERIEDALCLAQAMQKRGWAAPNRVIPNTEGGVSFERWSGEMFETIEIDGGGSIEARAFRGDRLIARKPWDFQR
jgi:hypothetical protein